MAPQHVYITVQFIVFKLKILFFGSFLRVFRILPISSHFFWKILEETGRNPFLAVSSGHICLLIFLTRCFRRYSRRRDGSAAGVDIWRSGSRVQEVPPHDVLDAKVQVRQPVLRAARHAVGPDRARRDGLEENGCRSRKRHHRTQGSL